MARWREGPGRYMSSQLRTQHHRRLPARRRRIRQHLTDQAEPRIAIEALEELRALRERAKQLGFRNIVVIDEDLGRSGSGIGNCLWDSSALQRDGSRRLPNHACAQRGPD